MWNGLSAPGRAGVLTQAQVKHILVKLHKRLSCLSGKLSPSVVLLQTVSILWCLVHIPCPLSLSPLSAPSAPHPPSLYSTYAHSRVELSWPGPSANRDSNGFNKNTVWGDENWISYLGAPTLHVFLFFFLNKGRRTGERERKQNRATWPKEDRPGLLLVPAHTLASLSSAVCLPFHREAAGNISEVNQSFSAPFFEIRVKQKWFKNLLLRFGFSSAATERRNFDCPCIWSVF